MDDLKLIRNQFNLSWLIRWSDEMREMKILPKHICQIDFDAEIEWCELYCKSTHAKIFDKLAFSSDLQILISIKMTVKTWVRFDSTFWSWQGFRESWKVPPKLKSVLDFGLELGKIESCLLKMTFDHYFTRMQS